MHVAIFVLGVRAVLSGAESEEVVDCLGGLFAKELEVHSPSVFPIDFNVHEGLYA